VLFAPDAREGRFVAVDDLAEAKLAEAENTNPAITCRVGIHVVAGESFLGASAENYEGFELDVPLD
jgi:hypothetical protein